MGLGNLLGMGLGNLLALVVGNVLAGSLNGGPHLVVAVAPPLVLAILLVLSCAFRLSVGLILRPKLLDADIFVDCGALLLILSMAFLSGGRLAQSLRSCAALLLIDC